MVSVEALRCVFRYADGHLYWKAQPWGRSHAAPDSPAGTVNTVNGYRYVTFEGKKQLHGRFANHGDLRLPSVPYEVMQCAHH